MYPPVYQNENVECYGRRSLCKQALEAWKAFSSGERKNVNFADVTILIAEILDTGRFPSDFKRWLYDNSHIKI